MIRKGGFNKAAADISQRYGESVSFDSRLYRTTSPARSRAAHSERRCAVTGQYRDADSALALGS